MAVFSEAVQAIGAKLGIPTLGRAMWLLVQRAKIIVAKGVKLNPGERVLIIYDPQTAEVAKAFEHAAIEGDARVVTMYALKECRFANGGMEELKALVQRGFDICFNFFAGSAAETSSRVELVLAQLASKARIGHGPGITKEMLQIEVNYPQLRANAAKIRAAFAGADRVFVTSPAGTKIEIKLASDRTWVDDVDIDKPGMIGNIPLGEIFVSPLEEGANGQIVVDGSIGDFGFAPSPIVIEVKNGRIERDDQGRLIGVHWQDPQYEDTTNYLGRLITALSKDDKASVIGEFGIGLLKAVLCGELLLDEKILGTAHIAFGNNEGEQGTNDSTVHRDFLMKGPTLEVFYSDPAKPSFVLMRDGSLTA